MIETVDHVADLRPQGGHEGGRLIAGDAPEQVTAREAPHDGKTSAAPLSPHG